MEYKMKYDIGNWIVFNNKEYDKKHYEYTGYRIYGKIGRIVEICYPDRYLIRFEKKVGDSYFYVRTDRHYEKGFYLPCYEKDLKLLIDHIKLKKLIEHGV